MEIDAQPAAAAVCTVLETDDLLTEILLRVRSLSTFVRAALVCKRWLGHVSDRAFLRRFRHLHPPRFLVFGYNGRVLEYDVSCRIPCNVHETEDGCLGDRARWLMIWPPKLPGLQGSSCWIDMLHEEKSIKPLLDGSDLDDIKEEQ